MNQTKLREFKILSIVCTILAVGTVTLFFYRTQTSQVQRPVKTYTVTDIPVSEAAALIVSNSQSVYALKPDGVNIHITGNVPVGVYSQNELRAAVYALCHITATRKITDLKNITQFGFDAPKARLSIIKKNKEEHLFALLHQNPVDNSYYLFSEDAQSLYLIPEFTAALLLKNESGYLEKNLFFTNSSNLPKTPELIQVDYASSFKTQGRAASDYIFSEQDGRYELSVPLRQKLNTTLVYSELVLPLITLQADEIAATDANLEEHGLDLPDFKISMFFGGVEQTVRFVRQGSYYLAVREGEQTILKTSRENLLFLEDGYRALFDEKAFYLEMGSARSLNASFEGDSHQIDISGSKMQITGTYRSKSINFEQLYALFETLNNTEIESEIPLGRRKNTFLQFDSPDIALEAVYDNGVVDLLEIAKAQNGICAIRVNGETNFMIPAAAAENIKNAFRQL